MIYFFQFELKQTLGRSLVFKLPKRNHRSIADFISTMLPLGDERRECITIEKLFGYQLHAPKRLVLQVVNELGLFNGYVPSTGTITLGH